MKVRAFTFQYVDFRCELGDVAPFARRSSSIRTLSLSACSSVLASSTSRLCESVSSELCSLTRRDRPSTSVVNSVWRCWHSSSSRFRSADRMGVRRIERSDLLRGRHQVVFRAPAIVLDMPTLVPFSLIESRNAFGQDFPHSMCVTTANRIVSHRKAQWEDRFHPRTARHGPQKNGDPVERRSASQPRICNRS